MNCERGIRRVIAHLDRQPDPRPPTRVGRNVKFTISCGIGGPCSGRKWDWSRLESRDSPARFPLWDAPLFPILLDRDPRGRLWLIAGTDEFGVWLYNGYPDPPYWAFTLKNDRWVLAPLPGEFMNRRANLLVDIRRGDSNRTLARELLARKSRPGGQEVWQQAQAIVERTENNGLDGSRVISDRSLPWRELAEFQE